MEKPFRFKQFEVDQNGAGFKFTTDSLLLGALAPVEAAKSILEIGPGTGVVSLMLAQRCPASVFAIEIDEDSARVAANNFSKSRWKERLTLRQGDATQYQLESESKVDWVVCNPPYFSDSMLSEDERKNRGRHQQSLNPATLLESFIRLSHEKGKLFIISTPSYVQELMGLGMMKGLWCRNIIDLYSKPGKEAIRQLLWIQKENCMLSRESFFIRDEKNQYSIEYKNALKDFLLKVE
jgi:tRNA1Val (adenine37-N6)-methyltransferase